MDELLAGLRAVAEITRLRILFALSHGEMNVTELTQVLGQSQPRVSRHLKLMAEAGLITRHKEGNWVLFRQREQGMGGALSRALVEMLPGHDDQLKGDLARLEQIRGQRQDAAAAYFAANAESWQELRSLHVHEEEVEAAFLAMLGDAHFDTVVDLGTGTGRILELLNGKATHLWGIDQSRDMLAIARAKLEATSLKNAQVRQGDIYALPFADSTADLISIHQVLHFLDDPQRALMEARRILKPGGKMIVVDFAPHELEDLRAAHAHRRLGISAEQMSSYLARAGLTLSEHRVLPPPWLKSGTGLTVSLWLASAPATKVQPAALSKARQQ
ncbi:ArsR/SmtB family transcription factor [Aestuariivirga litoralis]|uniref:ArsR/SmtB family transcription factor n=1 Tax=Aestuariivirga litoralis TaxID=2650924 RepID=UPI0018C72E0B|nr:metalloregulator ArsR/SmtB family transcription factor [Aestuariivirga litoralis]MBG1231973.1 metalloregulator ArsR/SmtB family transcription factor [Aestuariivirga litoralis]